MKLLIVIFTVLAFTACSDRVLGDDNTPKDNIPSNGGTMRITVGTTTFTATLTTNATTAAFRAMLPLTLRMSDFSRNEKVGALPHDLPVDAANPGIIRTGDIMLYGSESLVLFYETFSTSYSYTEIGRVNDPSALSEVLGAGDITLTFDLK